MPGASSKNPLFIPELFLMIIEYLEEPSPQSKQAAIPFPTPDADGRRALAVLARTCKTFTQTAIERLWRKLESLEPLVRCFTPPQFLTGSQRLRPPSQADWVIVRRYARFIRELQVYNDHSSFLLECATFQRDLFPNLYALKWNTRPTTFPISISLIQPLLGRRLVTLDLLVYDSDPALAPFFDVCPSLCPRLASAKFHVVVRGMPEMMDIYSQALCSFKHLNFVILDTRINDTALQHLFVSPQFRVLRLSIWPDQLRAFSPPPTVIPLRNVKALDLSLCNLCPLLQALRPDHQHFEYIMLRLVQLESATHIGSLFAGLAPPHRNSCLRLFHLSCMHPGRTEDNVPSALSFNTLRLLTCHTNLQWLFIRLENPISLSDEELEYLARSWPLLDAVCISYFSPLPPESNCITFKGLLLLASVCPKLRDVHLTLDGREVPSCPAELGSKTITKLWFTESPIDNQARRVAEFLLKHFPCLTSVSGAFKRPRRFGNGNDGEEWKRVVEYIVDPSKLERTVPGVDDGGI